MSRVKYNNFAVDASGAVISAAQVEVRNLAGDLVTLYAGETGSSQAYGGLNPFEAGDGSPDAVGFFSFWVEEDQVDITVGTGPSASTTRHVFNKDYSYASRTALVAAVASGVSWPNGTIVSDGTVSYKAISGSSVISDLLGLEPFRTWTFSHFGVSSSADSTAKAQAAITQAKAKGVKWLEAVQDMKLNTRVVITDDYLHVNLGGYRIIADEFTGYQTLGDDAWDTARYRGVFTVQGVEGPSTTLASAATQYSNTITVDDATGISAGFVGFMESDGELWYTSGSAVTKREPFRVQEVNGNDITLDRPLNLSYSVTGHTVNIRTANPRKGVRITGGVFSGGGIRGVLVNGIGPTACYMEGTESCEFHPASVSGFQGFVYRCTLSHFNKVSGYWQGYPDDFDIGDLVENENSGFYGSWFDKSSNCVADGIRSYRIRHTIDGSDSYNCIADNVAPVDNHRAAYTTHEGCDFWTFKSGCQADQVRHYGLQYRGHSLNVDGVDWRVEGDNEYGITVLNGTTNDLVRNVNISNSRILSNNASIYISSPNTNLSITDNYLTNRGSSIQAILLQNLYRAKIHGNYIKTTSSGCIQVQNATGEIIDCQGNTFEGYTSTPILNNATKNNIAVVAKNNTVIPGSGGSGIIAYPNRVSGLLEVAPNFTTSGYVWDAELAPQAFTPALTATVTTDFSYTSRQGIWQRVAPNLIFVQLDIRLSDLGTSDGIVQINLSDIPVTFSAIVDGAAPISLQNFTNNGRTFYAKVENSSSGVITLQHNSTGASEITNCVVAELQDDTTINMSAFLFVGG
jgi:hypothetical protein